MAMSISANSLAKASNPTALDTQKNSHSRQLLYWREFLSKAKCQVTYNSSQKYFSVIARRVLVPTKQSHIQFLQQISCEIASLPLKADSSQ
jgi:hypothetical protein